MEAVDMKAFNDMFSGRSRWTVPTERDKSLYSSVIRAYQEATKGMWDDIEKEKQAILDAQRKRGIRELIADTDKGRLEQQIISLCSYNMDLEEKVDNLKQEIDDLSLNLKEVDSECDDLLAIANLEALVNKDRAANDLNTLNYILNTVAQCTGFKGELTKYEELPIFFQYLRTRVGNSTTKKRRKK